MCKPAKQRAQKQRKTRHCKSGDVQRLTADICWQFGVRINKIRDGLAATHSENAQGSNGTDNVAKAQIVDNQPS